MNRIRFVFAAIMAGYAGLPRGACTKRGFPHELLYHQCRPRQRSQSGVALPEPISTARCWPLP